MLKEILEYQLIVIIFYFKTKLVINFKTKIHT